MPVFDGKQPFVAHFSLKVLLVATANTPTHTAGSIPDEHESPLQRTMYAVIAIVSMIALAVYAVVHHWLPGNEANTYVLYGALLFGLPILYDLAVKLFHLQFGSDLLAGISIITSVLMGEYLAGVLVILMVSGGETIERFAVERASSVLAALAKRMPTIAHRKNGHLEDLPVENVQVGDLLVVFPHEICPVDAVVVEGHGSMDESFLTGEPYHVSKTPGTDVISGALNGNSALTIKATRLPKDSRYAQIIQVMRASESDRPQLRRLGDQLGALYTPLAVGIAAITWLVTGEARRFLAVMVTATPCPLLIAIPVAVIGAISLAARRGIIIRRPAILEQVDRCRIAIFDKTGTLTYGRPQLTSVIVEAPFERSEVLARVASLERYSKHPLASAILEAAESENLALVDASSISERPGQGLVGQVDGHTVQVTSRGKLAKQDPEMAQRVSTDLVGLHCVVLVDGKLAATLAFRDQPRSDSRRFVDHLGPSHQFKRVMIISGDQEKEVRALAEQVGIEEVYCSQSPEQKLSIVRELTATTPTLYLGDGINDAPALASSTVGLAFGNVSDITSQAAGAVLLESSLRKVDELLHIGRRMRRIALQSAVGGMAASLIAMGLAAVGWLSPVEGAITQELIDVIAVLNALRVAWPPGELSDYPAASPTSANEGAR